MSSKDHGINDRPTATRLKRKDPKSEPVLVKVSPTSNLTNNIYEKVNVYEEKEAIARDGDKDQQLYLDVCDELRRIINAVAELKKKKGSEELIAENRIRASMLFIMLKKLNRLEKFRLNNNREKLNEARRQVDNSQLHLENLLYEIDHLKKEVSKCLQFTSRDESIELIPVEQFYSQSPEEISRPTVTKNDEHQLRLARLEWELEQRKTISGKCRELEIEKDKVSAAIQKKVVRITNLAPMIKNILNATKPVQEYLSLPMSYVQQEPELSNLLPHPLYFLSLQVDALREACDPLLRVKINGNREESKSFNTIIVDTPLEDDSDSDAEETKSRHRKKSYAQIQEEKLKNLFTKHPLSVDITISLKDGRSINSTFAYYPNLQIVTVIPQVDIRKPYSGTCCRNLLDSNSILDALFVDDYGDISPNTANHYQFHQLGAELNKHDHGIPYIWAQHLCGLSFPAFVGGSTAHPDVMTQKCTITTIKAIRKRLETRLDICFQMSAIEKTTLPVDLPPIYMQVKVNAIFSKWQQLDWHSYKELPYVAKLIKHQYVSQHDIFYQARIVRDSGELFAAIAVKADYPASAPVYALQMLLEGNVKNADNDDHIRDIERELNVHYNDVLCRLDKPFQLLTIQLYQLMISYDIYLECKDDSSYPREKLFLHSSRGRTRSLPLKYVHQANEGIFVQR